MMGNEITIILGKYLYAMCRKDRLLEIMHDFIVFDRDVKKICRHNQYFGVKAAQKEILVNFFNARGWDYQIYEEKEKTGANMDRVGFKKLMDDIEKEKPYAVVVAKIDRYARSLIDLLNSIFLFHWLI